MNMTRRNFVATTGAILATRQATRAAQIDIFEAAAAGNLERVKELAQESPAIVNSKAANGRTPLYFAAEAGQVKMVQLLSIGMFQAADLSAGAESPLIAV